MAVIFATSAVGCSVDVADVRLVVHVGIPFSIMSFS